MDTSNEQSNTETVNEPVAPNSEPTAEAAPPTPEVKPEEAPAPAPAPKKHTGLIIAVAVILVIFIGFGTLVASFMNAFRSPGAEDLKAYLEKKYGKSEEFSKGSFQGGSLFEVGYISYNFKSKRSSRPFSVTYRSNKTYSDNYYMILFEKEFSDYYGNAFKSAIPYAYTVKDSKDDYQSLYNYPMASENQKFNTFDEAIKFVGEESKNNHQEANVYLIVDYKEIGLKKLETLDLTLIRAKVEDIARTNNPDRRKYSNYNGVYAPDVTVNSVTLSISMEGSGRTGLCPVNLHADTYRGGFKDDSDSDEEIGSCDTILYQNL